MRSRLLRDGIAVSLFVAASALLWRMRVGSPVSIDYDLLGNSDQFAYFYPLHRLVAARLADGELPLWNPFQLAGVPLLATIQVGVFYPPNWLHLLLPSERALQVLAFGNLVIAGMCVYAFVRVLGVRPAAAAIGAGVYAWSCFIVGTHLWPPMVAVLCWYALPLVGIALIRRGQGLPGCIALALGLVMLLIGGYVPYAVHGFQLAAGYAVWNVGGALVAGDRQAARTMLRWLALGGAVGLLLAAPQWLPTLELARLATRHTGGLMPQQLEPFGPLPLGAWRRLFVPAESMTGYLAEAALLLVPAAFIARRHRAEASFFLLLAALAALIALGSATPLYELYLMLPGAKMFRGPMRILCLLVFGGSVLAALGADHLFARELAAEPRRTIALISCLLLAGVLMALQLGLPAWGVVTASLAIAFCIVLPPRASGFAASALVGLVLLSLAWMPANTQIQVWREGAMLRFAALHPELEQLASRLQLGRLVVARHSPTNPVVSTPHVLALHGLHVFEDYDPLSLRRYADYASFLQHGRLYDGSLERSQYAGSMIVENARYPRLLAAAGVLFTADIADAGSGRGQRLQLTDVPDALPRAYIVHGVQASRGAESTLRAIGEGQVDLRAEVVLESPPASALAAAGRPHVIERVRFTGYRSESIDLEVRMQRKGALVLLDLDYPGWRATVNGKDARIYNANHLFRAVLLPAGKHAVSFRYEPTSLRVGAVLGLFGLLGMGALCARLLQLRRAQRTPHDRSAPAAT